jgi:uncharacterized protein (DUF1684 family)
MSSTLTNIQRAELRKDDDGGPMALWDWRRQVALLYADVRAAADPQEAWRNWRDTRDNLFKTHDQSPIEPQARSNFEILPYFPYDASLRLEVGLAPVGGSVVTMDAGRDGATRMRAFAQTVGLRDRLGGELTLFWIAGYGGGVFLPFADSTNGHETYGAGRYLLDTIKGADLGWNGTGDLILDFNFAYNPSCSYSARYQCPLAPPSNRLSQSVRAGEKTPFL